MTALSTDAWLTLLRERRAVAVIRAPDPATSCQLARAAARGGVTTIEIAWSGRNPAEAIACIRAELPHCTVGAGTLLTRTDLNAAIAAGAQFAFMPHTDPEAIAAARTVGLPLVPGALTPTEIVAAWQTGASCVKVFPVSALGGAAYIRSLQGPLPQIPLVPTGGVAIAAVPAFLAAGAIAVGLSGDLFVPQLVAARDWDAIARRAAHLQQLVSHSTLT